MPHITTQPVTAYVLSWHRRPTGASWDICPTCTRRIGLDYNHTTYPANTPEAAIAQAYEDIGGDLEYYCPECGKTVDAWNLEPQSINVNAQVEHVACRIF